MALVALAFERVVRRGVQQRPGLGVAQGRRLAFVSLGFGPLNPTHRVVADRIGLAEVIEQGATQAAIWPNRDARVDNDHALFRAKIKRSEPWVRLPGGWLLASRAPPDFPK